MRQIRLSPAEFTEFDCKTELNVTYVWYTLFGRIIVEYIIWNHDFMLQKHEIQIPGIYVNEKFKFLEFTSMIMATTKEFLYFFHNLTNRTRRIYPDVNNHRNIG